MSVPGKASRYAVFSVLSITLFLPDHIYEVLNFTDTNTSKNVPISSEFNRRENGLYTAFDSSIMTECRRGQFQSPITSFLF